MPIFDQDLEDISNNDEYFLTQENYSYIDTSCTQDGESVEFDTGKLDEVEISKWLYRSDEPLADPDRSTSRLRVLFLNIDPDYIRENGISPLFVPCSPSLFNVISEAWEFPPVILKSLLAYASHSYIQIDSSQSISQTKRIGMVWKRGGFSEVVIYDIATMTTVVLVCISFDGWQHWEDELTLQIQRCKEAICDPFLFLLLSIEVMLRNDISSEALVVSEQMDDFREQADMEAFEGKIEGKESTTKFLGNEDLLRMTRDLTMLQERTIGSIENCAVLRQLEIVAARLHQDNCHHWKPTTNSETMPLHLEIQQRFEYVDNQLACIEVNLGRSRSEAQALVQTIYSLIAANDSRLNYEAAMASLRIAEDSRKVAILTRQDSTDMRVIAGTTLLFLPATFVATLFSTNFFNFQPSTGLVSKWIWLYGAVTAVLTIAVMTAWRLLLKARDKETALLLALKSKAAAKEDRDGGEAEEEGGSASGIALQDLKNRLIRRNRMREEDLGTAV